LQSSALFLGNRQSICFAFLSYLLPFGTGNGTTRSVAMMRTKICSNIGTLHRWREAPPGPRPALVATPEAREPDRTRGADDRIAELQLENSRLRRVVTDLLLEKIRLEEVAERQKSPRS